MKENGVNWRNRELRQHIKVLDEVEQPSLILKDATYLNVYTKQWLEANIWVFNDRIVYVGKDLPEKLDGVEVVNCLGKYIVPGYIDPHVHPAQLVNPETLAYHAAKYGTTTLVNDSLMWNLLLDKKKAFSVMEEFSQIPVSMYWWARLDSQTELIEEDEIYNTRDVLSWLNHPSVLQAGELTGWPQVLDGDDRILYWMQEAKRLGKRVEGHLPGASFKTLTKMKVLGVSADHEAMTADEAIERLQLGYHVSLRYSSIRPDLPELLEGILAKGITAFDNMTMTVDGGSPSFLEKGLINVCLEIAIEKGVPLEEAYRMASYNAARHFNLEEQLGAIAPGRIAHINILNEKENPHPVSVLAKGKWILKDGEEQKHAFRIDWDKYDIEPIAFDWNLTEGDLQFSAPLGMEMVNNVIVKPYTIDTDVTVEDLTRTKSDQFLLLMDRYGKWRVNTIIRGFAPKLGALASSFSASEDILLIGRSKKDMIHAWERLKELGGGIVLVNGGEILAEIELPLSGAMSPASMKILIEEEEKLKETLVSFGYQFDDPMYNLLFLSATHLPYLRVTQRGMVEVKTRDILFPATMR